MYSEERKRGKEYMSGIIIKTQKEIPEEMKIKKHSELLKDAPTKGDKKDEK